MNPKTIKSASTSKHPTALLYLFFAEMWERFGLYVIQGILVLYMTQHLGFSDDHAYAVFGAFSAFVYISPIFGGYVSNQVLGYRRTILAGILSLIVGYGMLAIWHTGLYWGLGLVILGNGLLKPNISSFLGDFYSVADVRRESGFTLFYVGINLGAFLGLTVSGTIAETIGWHFSFGVASLGLALALGIFLAGFKHYKTHGYAPALSSSTRGGSGWLRRPWVLALVAGLLWVLFAKTLNNVQLAHVCLYGIGVMALAWMLRQAFQSDRTHRNRTLAILLLIISSILYWSLYFQMFFSMSLFTERLVDRHFLGFEIPSSFYPSIESLFILTLGAAVARLWITLSKRKMNLSTPAKFALSLLILAAAQGYLYVLLRLHAPGTLVSSYFLIFYYFLVFLSEMLLSPIGLAMVTELAPPKIVGVMMGVWFLGLGYGGSLAGVLAQRASVPKGLVDLSLLAQIYRHAFLEYAILAVVVALALFACVPLLTRMMATKS